MSVLALSQQIPLIGLLGKLPANSGLSIISDPSASSHLVFLLDQWTDPHPQRPTVKQSSSLCDWSSPDEKPTLQALSFSRYLHCVFVCVATKCGSF